ncbi:MAG: M50 family metallopeptidase [Clostridia bacterium]|nr:M50 family metallopeptidase [Clostridia bacterium]
MKKSNKNKGKFIIHPLFLALSILFVLAGQGVYFVICLVVVILHEYAHYFVAKYLGYKLKQMSLLPYGAQLNLSKSIFNSRDEILIAIAGPLFNIVLAFFCIAIWWLYPVTYVYTEMFVTANLVIALFNLLPLAPLDGSRILLAILGKFGKRLQGYKIVNCLNIIVSILLFALFIASLFNNFNLSLGIMAIFIFAGAFEKDEAYLYSSLFTFSKNEYLNERPLKIKYYAVTKKINKLKIYRLINQNYYLVVVVLDENMQPIKYIYEGEFDKYFSA